MSTQPTDAIPAPDPAPRWHVRLVRRYLGAGPYLDYGCGDGSRLRRLADHGPATGFALSAEAARTAQAAAPGCPVLTDSGDMADDGFRGVVVIDTLTGLDDAGVRSALATWRRVLRPGGRLLVSEPDGAGRARGLRTDPPRPAPRSHDRWRGLLTGGGFEVVREGSDGLCDPPYGQIPAGLDMRTVPAGVQFMSGRLYLDPGSGESAVFVMQADG